ncbi:hypothetical protein RB195_005298 [Necator americanus]|uniref:Uncharacterized protein n=2 Tax=Necator americanus TaxID=51031 RepID=A0ABR1BM59_NECAM
MSSDAANILQKEETHVRTANQMQYMALWLKMRTTLVVLSCVLFLRMQCAIVKEVSDGDNIVHRLKRAVVIAPPRPPVVGRPPPPIVPPPRPPIVRPPRPPVVVKPPPPVFVAPPRRPALYAG